MKSADIPLRATMCATCPFKPGSKYEYLVFELTRSAVMEASRVCHSTGKNAINRKTGKPSHLCRGARDVQLSAMANAGAIDAPTDEAWNNGRVAIGMKRTEVKDP